MDKKPEYRFYRLFALKLSGEASPEELMQLEAILMAHPELQFLYDELIKPVQQTEQDAERAEQSYAAHAVNMHLKGLWEDDKKPEKTEKKFGRRVRLAWYVAAASIVLMAGANLAKLLNRRPMPATDNETATYKGSKSTVKLPDGTVVMLNANSKLHYDENFTGDNREVTLLGEAYFDVAHDAAHPFIVHTQAGDIKVLGTAFNVKAFENGFFETALIRGKVAIHLKHHVEENFVLNPGQKLVTTERESNAETVKIVPVTTVKDSLVAETSWTKGKLVFVNKTLAEIAADLERIFGVTISFKSNEAKEYRYTGVFDDTSLDQIFEILKLSRPITYHRYENLITIE